MILTDSMPVVRRTVPSASREHLRRVDWLMHCQVSTLEHATFCHVAPYGGPGPSIKHTSTRNAPVPAEWAGDLMRHHADAPKAESAAYGQGDRLLPLAPRCIARRDGSATTARTLSSPNLNAYRATAQGEARATK